MIHAAAMGVADGLPSALVHCFLGHSGGWAALLAAMRHPLAAVAVDLPGHGRSSPFAGGDLQGVVADDLAQRLEGRRLLIGQSFGGTVALRVALEHPGKVSGLVLIEPVLLAAARAEPEAAGHAAAHAPIDAALAAGDPARAAELFLKINDPASDWAALPERLRATFARQIPLLQATTAAVRDDSAGLVRPGRLEGVDFPVLLICGALSPPIFHAIHRVLSRRIPGARARMVEGAGHMAPMTHPAQTAAILDDWIAQELKTPRAG